MEKQLVGSVRGKEAYLYSSKNASGATMTLTNYGATICSMKVPDRNGVLGEVLFGFAEPKDYVGQDTVYGATIGPVANRIADGSFRVDGKEYHTPIGENGVTTLHSGPDGFQYQVWDAEPAGENALRLTYHRPDGEAGFPGNMDVAMVISLTEDNVLRLEYEVSADQKTPLNITNHAYFNLAGQGDIYGHAVQIDADSITLSNALCLPTGEVAPVAGTPFDLNERHIIGEQMDLVYPQIEQFGGYDHNFIIRGEGFRRAGLFLDPASGRCMEIYTDMPGMQLYTDNRSPGKDKVHMAACFETQFYPDGLHHDNFPSILIGPERKFVSKTEYRFFTE